MSEVGRLAIIAGGGGLPVKAYFAARERNLDVQLVALKGFTDAALRKHATVEVALGEIGKLLSALAESERDTVLFCGLVSRPDFRSLSVDWKGVSLLPRVIAAARRGDDALLRELAAIFEENGLRVIGVDAVATGLLMPEDTITATKPDAAHVLDIERALHVAGWIGREDIGQGAVVADGVVLAVEAQEGTDAMLARVSELPVSVRGTSEHRRGVLAKVKKPIQDHRLDLPTIGVRTIEGVAAAGLAGLVAEANGALIVDRDAMIARADELGIFVTGRSCTRNG